MSHRRFFDIVLFALFYSASVCVLAIDYATCDFDLENIALILPHLPEKCWQIYADREIDKDTFALYENEGKEFKKFFEELDNYELRNVPGGLANADSYPFEADIRARIYAAADRSTCIGKSNSSEDNKNNYINCFLEKRRQLRELVPTAGSGLR